MTEQSIADADEVMRELLENRPRVDKATEAIRHELNRNHFSARLDNIFKGGVGWKRSP